MRPPPELVLEARDLRARLSRAARDAVRDVSLTLRACETLVVLGPSGSGKSTLAMALVGAIPDGVPGEVGGFVRRPDHASGGTACVLQDTDAALVALTVEDEIAFAIENRGLPPAAIEERIAEALARPPAVGLGRRDRTLELSGGWRQRLAIAAALAEKPALVVMDEPFAHLAETAASEAADAARTAMREGTALLLIEHRAEQAARMADAVLVLGPDGAPAAFGPPGPILYEAARRRTELGLRLPAAIRAGQALIEAGLLPAGSRPLDAEALMALLPPGRADAAAATTLPALGFDRIDAAKPGGGPALVTLDDASLRRSGRTVLDGIDLEIRAGEVLGIAGPNGAGKTSLALLAAGGLKASRGSVLRTGERWPLYVPQNPNLAFASGSLTEEARRRNLPWSAAEAAISAAGLEPDPARHPLTLSHGERRRLAFALAFAEPRPGVTILDEPGAALDQNGLDRLSREIRLARKRGDALVVIAHDLDWLATIADRIAILDFGRIAALSPPAAILRDALAGRLPVEAPEGARLASRLGWPLTHARAA